MGSLRDNIYYGRTRTERSNSWGSFNSASFELFLNLHHYNFNPSPLQQISMMAHPTIHKMSQERMEAVWEKHRHYYAKC
jgi:hypothetical protein